MRISTVLRLLTLASSLGYSTQHCKMLIDQGTDLIGDHSYKDYVFYTGISSTRMECNNQSLSKDVPLEFDYSNLTLLVSDVYLRDDHQDIENHRYKYVLEKCRELRFINSTIRIVPAGVFNFANITHIDLRNCSIETIEDYAFNGMKNLQKISLQNNLIANISSKLFAWLPQTRFLSLEHNQIATIADYAFVGFTRLEELHLQNNRIKMLPVKALHGLAQLRLLNLTQNTLSTFEFSSLHMVQILLDYNRLEHLLLSGLIEAVHAQNNQLVYMKKTVFASCSYTMTIDLSFNSLLVIERGVFYGLKYLQNLFLQNNRISHIFPESFKDLRELQYLNISHNKIGKIESDTFLGLHALQDLDLSNNRIHYLNYDCLRHLPDLQDLSISGNFITTPSWLNVKQLLPKLINLKVDCHPSNYKLLTHLYNSLDKSGLKSASFYNAPHMYGVPCDVASLKFSDYPKVVIVNQKPLIVGLPNKPWYRYSNHPYGFIHQQRDKYLQDESNKDDASAPQNIRLFDPKLNIDSSFNSTCLNLQNTTLFVLPEIHKHKDFILEEIKGILGNIEDKQQSQSRKLDDLINLIKINSESLMSYPLY